MHFNVLSLFRHPRRYRGRPQYFDADEQQDILGDNNQMNLSEPHARSDQPVPLSTMVSFAAVPGLAKNMMLFLVPSFLQDTEHESCKLQAHHPSTSSLDGLRGYAAFAVMNYHILYAYQSFVFYGYGLPQAMATSCVRPEDVDSHHSWIHQLPILRMVYGGTWPISVFFVISGFALSHNTLKLSRNPTAEFANGAPAVASGLLRRPFRLYGPPTVATFITMVAIQLGAFEPGRQISRDPKWVPVINETHHTRFDTFGLQLADWLHETWRMLDVFWWGDRYNQYDVHLWTIPTEYRCSLAVFLALPMYISIKSRARLFLMIFLTIYVYALDRWDVALFFSGLLIADTSIDWQRGVQRTRAFSACVAHRVTSATVRATLFAVSLILLSSPEFCISETPLFKAFGMLIPSSDPAPFRFIPNLGGIVLVALIAHTSPSNFLVSKLLNSALPQYLGRISYSLYIVHGPLIHTVGYLVFPTFWNLTGLDESWRYVVGFFAAYFVFLAVVVCVADVFWRSVDAPCVRLAKMIHSRVST